MELLFFALGLLRLGPVAFFLLQSMSPLFFSNLFAVLRFGSCDSGIELFDSNSYFVVNGPISEFSGTLTVPDDNHDHVSGQNINFKRGNLSFGKTTDISFSGTFSQDYTYELVPENNSVLHFDPGEEVPWQIKIPSGSTVTLSGVPTLKKPVLLEDNTSVLRLSIQGPMTQDIVLNGGTVILDDNFSWKAGSKFVGSGVLDINGRSYEVLGATDSDGDLLYLNANDQKLRQNTIITSRKTFSNSGAVPSFSDIEGNGFTYTFSSPNGKIRVGADHTLYCAEVHFVNVGRELPFGQGTFEIHPTSTVVFQRVTLELAGDYHLTQGTMIFKDSCKVITHGFSFKVSGLDTRFIVDGTALEYENGDSTYGNPFIFSDEAVQKIFLNGGTVRSTIGSGELRLIETFSTSTEEKRLSAEDPINFINPDPLTLRSVVADFNGHRVTFPSRFGRFFNLDPNVNLTCTNVVFSRFNKDGISYADSNAFLNFGEGTSIGLHKEVVLSGTDNPWNFVGNSSVFGEAGKVSLILESPNVISVGNASTLTLRNLRVVINDPDAISVTDFNSKVSFVNCDVVLGTSGVHFANGSLEVRGQVCIFGANGTEADVDSPFIFSSPGTFMIQTGSILRMGKNVIFEYKADPLFDMGVTYNSKRHFKLVDSLSTLDLDGCTVHSTFTGLAIDYGRLIIRDSVNFISDGAFGTEMEIGSSVDLRVLPAASLNITGTLSYNATAFP